MTSDGDNNTSHTMATMVGRYELATRNVILPSRGRRFFFLSVREREVH